MKIRLDSDILIVDRNYQTAQGLKKLLDQSGLQIRHAPNGKTAITQIVQQQPSLILTDFHPSRLEGYQILAYTQKEWSTILVVALIDAEATKVASQSLQMGAFDYVLKPFDDTLILATIARAAEKARLNRYDQLRQAMITAVGSTLALESMMEQVLTLAQQGVRAKNGSLFILDDQHQVMRHLILVEDGQVQTVSGRVQQLMQEGFIGWLYRERKSAIIKSTVTDDRWLNFPDRPNPVQSAIGLPFISRNKIQGLLLLLYPDANHFDDLDGQFLESIALPAAMAIENARLFAGEQQKSQEMTTLYQTGLMIASVLDYNLATRTIVEQIATTIGVDICAITRWDKSKGCLTTISGLTWQNNQWQERTDIGNFSRIYDYPLLRTPLFDQESVTCYRHGTADDKGVDEAIQRWMDARRVHVLMLYPLILRDQTTGLILLGHTDSTKNFSDRDKRLMQGVAAQVSTTLENVRLFETVKAQSAWMKAQAQKLADERRKLAAILQNTPDVVLAIDKEGQILLANLAMDQAFGLNSRSLLHQPYKTALQDTDLSALFDQVRIEDTAVSLEVESSTGRTYYANVTPVPKVGYVALLRDISHLKELDRMRTELLSTASHDLKNPLALIQGFTHLLLETDGLDLEQKALLEHINRTSFRMANLIGDLLDLTQLEFGITLNHDLHLVNNIAREALTDVEGQAKLKGITIRGRLSEGQHVIICDARRIQQAIVNLLTNAIKYTAPGGYVTLKTIVQLKEQRALQPQEEVLVSVQDTGDGISPEDLPRIFDRFYRVKDHKLQGIEGTGLGLAIVKTIIDQHNGQIWVESEPNKGSTFTFGLPIISSA